MQRKMVNRKFKRENPISKTNQDTYTMSEMLERFMKIKMSEGLARRTII
ncbi:MAG: hypothetical protein Q8934_16290 [Bacillota bacterium]|nr:hypothetical protein [Bacillota bacterium]